MTVVNISNDRRRILKTCVFLASAVKSKASKTVLRYVKRFEKKSGYTVKRIHSDNGAKYSHSFTSRTEDGINGSITTPDTPKSNALAERTHQTVMNDVRCCLTQAHLAECF